MQELKNKGQRFEKYWKLKMIKIQKLYKTYSRTKKDKKREGTGVQNVKSCSNIRNSLARLDFRI